jgi:hypothetical protein
VGSSARAIVEVAPLFFRLEGPMASSEAEISGMTWDGDRLLLLPQYPYRHAAENMEASLYVLDRALLIAALEEARAAGPGEEPPLLRPRPIAYWSGGMEERLINFDGYEAVAVRGDRIFFAVEARPYGPNVGYLLRGRIDRRRDQIHLERALHPVLTHQLPLPNVAYEAMVLTEDRVLLFYEANGEINDMRQVLAFDHDLRPLSSLSMPTLEYRLTDATEIDEEGSFEGLNFHWSRSPWPAGECALQERYGEGPSHARYATVERLVSMRVEGDRVLLNDRAPIQLQLVDDNHSRNWEGIVRFGRGFLLVTDEHPETLFAYIEPP